MYMHSTYTHEHKHERDSIIRSSEILRPSGKRQKYTRVYYLQFIRSEDRFVFILFVPDNPGKINATPITPATGITFPISVHL